MKKIMFISFIGVSILLAFIGLNSKSNYLREDNILGIYLDNELQESIPKKGEAVFSKAVCDNNATKIYWDIDKWGLFISNLSKKTKCNLYFVNYSGQTIFDFDYTGSEQTFTAPESGTYRLETWGAQGGNYGEYNGGYGGYSIGIVHLKKIDNIYLNIGGAGETKLGVSTVSTGGYNGGGNGKSSYNNASSFGSGGGGASHISTKSGLLSSLENNKDNILIMSGGGGGIYVDMTLYPKYSFIFSGNGGGFKGSRGKARGELETDFFIANGGTQTDGYSFGMGETCIGDNIFCEKPGGGGGFYGGNVNKFSAGGGSGYIGNPSLTNKAMYCYNCEESNEESTKTISTTCSEETPTSYCAKKGNGYARITLVSID